MKDSVNLKWINNLAFEAEVDGHKMIIDAKPEVGGTDKGPRPKPLMMVALGGCTGMDVASLLKKMRVEVDELNIKIEGDITEEHPKHFAGMHIIYEFKGKDLPLEKLEKAIDLSQKKYCGVSESYRKAMKLTYEIRIV
ncbi:MAG: OsmC family protein [Bacteroidales bacterium]|nr:MAG: OsmC family protein [Bacteroidales bacterium]